MIEFVGASYQDASSKSSNTSRLVNLWADKVEEGGRTRRLLRSALGLESYATVANVFCRDMFNMDGTIYSVVGNGLYKGSALVGTVASGNANISRNGATVTVASGGVYYTSDGVTVTVQAGGPFAAASSVEFLAGRTLVTEASGNRIMWSDIGNPASLPGLNVASAESRDDKIIRGMVVGGIYYVLGERSTELWAATGAGGSGAFELLSGAVTDIGLKAYGLAVKIDGGLFMVGDDDIVYLAAGTESKPVSIAPVSTAIKQGDPKTCIYWEDRGHKFAAITFNDRPAWVYTITTGEWWERAEKVDNSPWRAKASVKVGSDWIVGADDGGFYRLRGVQDVGQVLRREMTSFAVYNDGKWFSIPELEFYARSGYDDASLMLEVSRDGETFGLVRTAALSDVGNFGLRTVFRNLGRSRQFVLRASLTDPVDVPIWAAARMRAA